MREDFEMSFKRLVKKICFMSSPWYVSVRTMFQLPQRRNDLMLLIAIKMQSYRLKCENIAKKDIDMQQII